jgi:quinol-cytochrome oxidoreductase complex cytochrome b subunit
MPYLDRSRIPGGASNRPIVKIGFYLFLLNMLVLGYVGYTPPTDQTILIGQIATFCYFGSFFLIPFISVAEERWLIRRGLPPEVEALIASEASEKTKMPDRRHNKGDMA